MSKSAKYVEYVLDQIDTVLMLKAKAVIRTSSEDLLFKPNSDGNYQATEVKTPVAPDEHTSIAEIYLDISFLPEFIQSGILMKQFGYSKKKTAE